jgi:hypothetical protein
VTRFLLALLLVLQVVFTMAAQEPAKATSAKPASKSTTAANDIFSGTVTVYMPESVTVVRKVPARADEYRVFAIDKDTKIEGKPRVSARVTVRFKADGDGAVHALRIIVRADVKAPAGAGKSQQPAVRR